MSDPKDQQSESPTQDVLADRQLQTLVQVTNATAISFPLTLNVGGMLVSGSTITPKRYFQKVTEMLEKRGTYSGSTPEIAAQTKEFTVGIFAPAAEEEPETLESDDLFSSQKLPHFILLEDVRFIQPGGIHATNMLRVDFWRGRIDKVDGFSIGRME